MTRPLFALACAVLLGGITSSAADDDAVRKKLDAARTAYDKTTKEHKEEVGKWFAKEDADARKLKTGVAEKVKQVATEKKEFEDNGTFPKRAPIAMRDKSSKAADAIIKAHKVASDEYLRLKKDDEAAAVEKELEAFRIAVFRHADAVKFGTKYYKVFADNLKWHDAKKRCGAMKGSLVVVTSAEMNEFLIRLVLDAKLDSAWLGGTDEKKNGEWVWIDGTPMKYSNWLPGQPNNQNKNEHYLLIGVFEKATKGKWADKADAATGQKPGFICQW